MECPGLYSFVNLKTERVSCVDTSGLDKLPWQLLAVKEEKSLVKGHVWQQLSYVPVRVHVRSLEIVGH